MLARAVEKHDAVNNLHETKATNLGKQLFPSSSPSESTGRLHQGVLKPTSSSTVNGSRGSIYQPLMNPLKRTASQVDRVTTAHYPPTSSTSTTQPSMSGGYGVVNKLHDSVFFDENDFVDDNDLDLEFETQSTDPVQYPTLYNQSTASLQSQTLPEHGPNTPLNYPQLPKQVTPSTVREDSSKSSAKPSSVPIEWSSSPPTHKAPLAGTAALQPPPALAVTNEAAAKGEVASTSGSVARPPKRRTLPWLNKDEDGSSVQAQEVSRKQGRGRPKTATKDNEEPYTPLPKNTANATHPWNKTASAIKEEQKKHRQKANQGKKLIKQGAEGVDVVTKTTSRNKNMARIFLSDEQKKVLELVVEANKSCFFTGSAGTGKSVLMREIISALRKKHKREADRVAVTASTGLAACNIGGVTLHSFAGIGLGKEPAEELIKRVKRNQKAKSRWMRTKVLIIDEISMVDGALFDKLEQIARAIRNNGRPFGGMQLVVTGDFFQLPPVPDYKKVATFAFDAITWGTSIQHTIGLTQVFRQKDPAFANMLNEMRVGKLSKESINAFYKLNRKLDFVDDVEATELFPRRDEVEKANHVRMQQLGGRTQTFTAQDGGTITDLEQRGKLLTNCMAPQSITLKKGAQVMLIKNLDDSLVNGSIGKVVAFMDERTYAHYEEDEDSFQPLDFIDLDDEKASAAREKLKSLYNKDNLATTSQLWPLVRFPGADGSFRDLLCVRETWKIELPSGEVQAQRSQIPLILAWALSIHKAQGQTLERVRVDLGNIFEKGQAYVALSRATSQEGLQIIRFDPKKVMAHDKVRQFYDSLYSADTAASTDPSSRSRLKTLDSMTEEELAMEDWANDQAVGDTLYR